MPLSNNGALTDMQVTHDAMATNTHTTLHLQQSGWSFSSLALWTRASLFPKQI